MGKKITYTQYHRGLQPQKSDPNRIIITVWANLIKYPHEVTIGTADTVTINILWNSVSSPYVFYVCDDVKNFYLNTPMECFEYMGMPIKLIPQSFMMSMTSNAILKIDFSTWKLGKKCMDYYMLASWPSNCWRKGWLNMILTKSHIHQVYGSIKHNQ